MAKRPWFPTFFHSANDGSFVFRVLGFGMYRNKGTGWMEFTHPWI